MKSHKWKAPGQKGVIVSQRNAKKHTKQPEVPVHGYDSSTSTPTSTSMNEEVFFKQLLTAIEWTVLLKSQYFIANQSTTILNKT